MEEGPQVGGINRRLDLCFSASPSPISPSYNINDGEMNTPTTISKLVSGIQVIMVFGDEKTKGPGSGPMFPPKAPQTLVFVFVFVLEISVMGRAKPDLGGSGPAFFSKSSAGYDSCWRGYTPL